QFMEKDDDRQDEQKWQYPEQILVADERELRGKIHKSRLRCPRFRSASAQCKARQQIGCKVPANFVENKDIVERNGIVQARCRSALQRSLRQLADREEP